MGEMVQLQVDQGLATITINRPERMNALTPQMIVDLTDMARDSRIHDGDDSLADRCRVA